ncbi:MAG: hypothetical protein KDG50_06315 [Chromatiales bacterium]|nr:hypothetical protein [Chromatiales bacterium]
MTIRLEPLKHEVSDGHSTRRCRIQRLHVDGSHEESEIWFQLDSSVPLPDEDDCDAYVLAVVMDAMRENRTIEVKGSVSKQLLSNLVEFQAAWNRWKPDTYGCVEINVAIERHPAASVPGAICAFSGGVDATFSVWRHSQSKNGHRSQQINLCAMVHGFDIPLADQAAFDGAKSKAARTLHDVGIGLMQIRTNYREISKVHWADSFSIALVSTLGNFKRLAGTCIIGSGQPYESLLFPWGSSPITDHLLGSGDFVVMHDGASHSRTEKVKEISEWKIGMENLRVCWQGRLKDRNCGICEKCVRTKLNFLASGTAIPACFPETNILDDLKTIELKNDHIRVEWSTIYRYAEDHGVQEPWVGKVRRIAPKRVAPILDIVFPKGSVRRKMAKYLKTKLGRS